MVRDAMSAHAEEDPGRCLSIAEHDEGIDERCTAASEVVVRDLIGTEVVSEDPAVDGDDQLGIEALMDDVSRLPLTVRDPERVGDHAVEIAARTLCMVENDDLIC